MGIRPNKTNFGLLFGHFLEQKHEEEKKKRRRRRRRRGKVWIPVWILCVCMELGFCIETMFLYGFITLSMEVFVWILVVPFLGFS